MKRRGGSGSLPRQSALALAEGAARGKLIDRTAGRVYNRSCHVESVKAYLSCVTFIRSVEMKRRKLLFTCDWLLLACIVAALAALPTGCKTTPPGEEDGEETTDTTPPKPTGPYADLEVLFPAKGVIEDWERPDSVRLYLPSTRTALETSETVELLSAGLGLKATIFESYAYRAGGAVTYERPIEGEDEIVSVWIHEMADAEDAFGIFSVAAVGDEFPDIGLLARQTSNTLGFVKGPYFVDVAYSGTGDPAPILAAFAEWIADRIEEPGAKPAILSQFPEGAKPGEIYYLHKFEVLDALPFVPKADPDAVEVVLGLGDDTEMAIVGYPAGDTAINRVFVIKYADQADANVAYRRYTDYLDNSEDPAEQKIIVSSPVGAYLVGSFNAEEDSIQLKIPQILAALAERE